ncbi:MAG TPA: hypothetical protein ENN19_16605, partial [Chloroflexi bacterium]|nr:hypothetical protein [Chloroflexota bacterium]
MLQWRTIIRSMLALGLALGMLVLLCSFLTIRSARAQAGGGILVDKQLGRGDPTVHVGEYLTFTIRIENNTAFTITRLPLDDTYNAGVLGYVDAAPVGPDSVDEGAGRLAWNDLTEYFGDLTPGQVIMLVVGFVAEHPREAVVNAARVHDALYAGGALSDTQSTITTTEAIGGSAPVNKALLADMNPLVGQPLTFTLSIRNNGFTTLTVVPLVDTYDPALLAFSRAAPWPDLVDPVSGVLTWHDVTSYTGDIPPHGSVTVTTVFTALAASSGDTSANRAEIAGASDWYGNDVDGGADEVPITIIDDSTPVPTTTPTPV